MGQSRTCAHPRPLRQLRSWSGSALLINPKTQIFRSKSWSFLRSNAGVECACWRAARKRHLGARCASLARASTTRYLAKCLRGWRSSRGWQSQMRRTRCDPAILPSAASQTWPRTQAIRTERWTVKSHRSLGKISSGGAAIPSPRRQMIFPRSSHRAGISRSGGFTTGIVYRAQWNGIAVAAKIPRSGLVDEASLGVQMPGSLRHRTSSALGATPLPAPIKCWAPQRVAAASPRAGQHSSVDIAHAPLLDVACDSYTCAAGHRPPGLVVVERPHDGRGACNRRNRAVKDGINSRRQSVNLA